MYHSAINFKFLLFKINLNFRLSSLDFKLQTMGPLNFKQHLIKNVKKNMKQTHATKSITN